MSEKRIGCLKMKRAIVFSVVGICAAFLSFGEISVARSAFEVRTFRLQYASASEVAGQINRLMSREAGPEGTLLPVAVANAEANTVTVMVEPDKVAACGQIIADVDRKPKQVYVEARFVALSSSVARNLGLKWDMLRSGVGVRDANVSGSATYQHVPDGVREYKESITGGRSGGYGSETVFDLANKSHLSGMWADASYFQGTISSSDMHLLLQAFDDDANLKTFANPKIIVSSGKEATVDIATTSPYVELSAKRAVGDETNILDVDARLSAIPGKDATFSGEVFFSFGIELKVLPRVLANGLINVVITPAITSPEPSADVTVRPSATESSTDFNGMDIPQMTYPGIDMQRIITEFTMKSGETAVIGGMTRAVEQDQEDGIPYLRAIPLIGKWLFGSTTKVKAQEDVLVFVTVGEVDPEGVKGAAGAPAASAAVKRYPDGLNERETKE